MMLNHDFFLHSSFGSADYELRRGSYNAALFGSDFDSDLLADTELALDNALNEHA
jgi:hypothetical protein